MSNEIKIEGGERAPLLRKLGWLSLLGSVCVGIVLSVTLGILFGGDVVPSALVGGTMSAAFSVAARLPLVRSESNVS